MNNIEATILGSHSIFVDYYHALKYMINRANFENVSCDICYCPNCFTTSGKGKQQIKVELLSLITPITHYLDTETVLEEIDRLGFRPAKVEELVALSKVIKGNGNEIPQVVALGTFTKGSRRTVRAAVLSWKKTNPVLSTLTPYRLREGKHGWGYYDQFAVVKK